MYVCMYMQSVYVTNPGFPWQQKLSAKKTLFTNKLDFNLKKKLVKCYIATFFMVLKSDSSENQIKHTLKILKSDVGEG